MVACVGDEGQAAQRATPCTPHLSSRPPAASGAAADPEHRCQLPVLVSTNTRTAVRGTQRRPGAWHALRSHAGRASVGAQCCLQGSPESPTHLEHRGQGVVHFGLQLAGLVQGAQEVGLHGRRLLGLACRARADGKTQMQAHDNGPQGPTSEARRPVDRPAGKRGGSAAVAHFMRLHRAAQALSARSGEIQARELVGDTQRRAVLLLFCHNSPASRGSEAATAVFGGGAAGVRAAGAPTAAGAAGSAAGCCCCCCCVTLASSFCDSAACASEGIGG